MAKSMCKSFSLELIFEALINFEKSEGDNYDYDLGFRFRDLEDKTSKTNM